MHQPLIPHRAAAAPKADIAADCRHYRGDRPCHMNRLCRGCESYAPFASRICIIKLGALGDVIRTLCILPALRERYPDAQITWVSKPSGCRMIDGHPMIDRVLPFDPINAMALARESFDLLINLDKEAEPSALAMMIDAPDKRGVALNSFGKPVPFNHQAQHYFNLGLSDELKFNRNTYSYQKLVYDALGLDYKGERYELPRNTAASFAVRSRLHDRGWQYDRTTVGVNVGAGAVFANKMWPVERTIELIQALRAEQTDAQVLLLGGPSERPVIDQILEQVTDADVIDGGTDHDEPHFTALVDCCDVVFCGDTMAMHVAIALSKQVVVLFGPTCEQEIDLFGKGEKLVAQMACAPCYKRKCDQNDACVQDIGIRDAVNAISRAVARANCRVVTLPTYVKAA